MSESQPENFSQYEKLLAALAQSKVDFAVVGGVAVSLNGFVRATEDLDIIISEAAENAAKLLDCLSSWGEGWARELQPGEFVPQEGSIRLIEDFPLDIFTRMRGRSLEDFRPRLRHAEIGLHKIAFLAAEDLIFLKQNSWREKDQIDVLALRRMEAR